ncbi:MAG: phosphoglucosamine mutase [Alphaproteobacteria bacterium]|nr:phosphoglucosamine mutase [Alphaproteobacteria bacterium]
MGKLFGTDGIRGAANSAPMTAEIAMKVAIAAGKILRQGNHRHRVVIGKDTRLSGYMFQPALTAGFVSIGMDVVILEPLPTPAVAMLTRSLRADLGVMISASHNPHHDNGIKLFGPDGYKLSDELEAEIERTLDGTDGRAPPETLGRVRRLDDAPGRYIESVKSSFPKGLRLDGLKIVVDCANGAAYRVAPTVLWELGAEIVPIAVEPDGLNINRGCGATHIELLQQAVVTHGAHIGLALDGDADRVQLVDERGHSIDGDQVLACIARGWKNEGRLRGTNVVATVMSNLGLEKWLAGEGLKLARAKVGDRHVLEMMRELDANLGGEQSGHVILSDYATTGDGLIAGLQVLAAIVHSGKKASEVAHVFEPYPQLLKNVRFAGPPPMDSEPVRKAIAAAEAKLSRDGRLLIRKSGTEPVVRVMAEAGEPALVREAVELVVDALLSAGGTLAGGTKASKAASSDSPERPPEYPRYLDRRSGARRATDA